MTFGHIFKKTLFGVDSIFNFNFFSIAGCNFAVPH